MGRGLEGLFAFSKIWGLCLSEVHPTPPLHSRSPRETLSPGLLVRVPGWGWEDMVRNAGATVEFQGRRPPMARIFSSTRKTVQRPHTHGKKIKGRTSYALHKVSTARGGGKGGTIFTTHLLPQNQGMNCICKRHCLSKSLDIQHVGVGGWLGLSRTAAKMGRGRGWTHTQPVKSCA